MKNIIISFILFAVMGCTTETKAKVMKKTSYVEAIEAAGYGYDSFVTPSGRNVRPIFIKHGSVGFDIDGYMVYIDPVTIFGNDLSRLPKADMILITHEHHDHLDVKGIDELRKDTTKILSSVKVSETLKDAEPVEVGKKIDIPGQDIVITTVPAYNITDGHQSFHPRERGDLGFVINVDGFKIYVAGDTEDIPEMKTIGDEGIDIAFIPVNQPYTMTPAQAIHAVELLRPRIVYPYHYGTTDLTPVVNRFDGSEVEVRVRDLD